VDSIHISLYPNSGIQVTSDTVILSGSSLQLEVSGGPFNAYRWEPSNWLDNSTVPDPIATPEEAIRYRVFATNEYGCEEMDSVFIDVIEDLKVYNVFSPNGDGVNDYFEIDHAENFPEMRVEIYSRWGDLLYSTVGYDSGSKWDGNARGTEAPVGTYYYVIIPYSGAKPMTGNVTIIR
jgi:gliding motility-associated-like protein